MAKDVKGLPPKKDPGKAKADSGMGFIIALVLLTLIAGGGGFVFAKQFLAAPHAVTAAAPAGEKPVAAEHGESGHSAGPKTAAEAPLPKGELLAIPPIITNLAQPAETYVRLEGAILVEPGYSDGKILAAKVSEDVIVLLRTMSMAQIQGSAGLSHLREDLNDRVRIRSENKAREFIINTMVVE